MRKETKCRICGDHIDRTACDINFMILTEVDHRPSPIKQSRSYICEDCSYAIRKHIDLLTLEQITASL